jgi:hypothetical protein
MVNALGACPNKEELQNNIQSSNFLNIPEGYSKFTNQFEKSGYITVTYGEGDIKPTGLSIAVQWSRNYDSGTYFNPLGVFTGFGSNMVGSWSREDYDVKVQLVYICDNGQKINLAGSEAHKYKNWDKAFRKSVRDLPSYKKLNTNIQKN